MEYENNIGEHFRTIIQNRMLDQQKELRRKTIEQLTDFSSNDKSVPFGISIDSKSDFSRNEIEQEKLILRKLNQMLENRVIELEKNINGEKYDELRFKEAELEQEKLLLEELEKNVNENHDVQTSNFLSTLSHELKTSIVPISAYADILLDDKYVELNEKQRENLKTIKSNVTSFLGNISDIFDCQKLLSDQITMNKKTNHLKTIINDSIFKSQLTDKIKIVHNENYDFSVLCDEKRILQVLTSLLNNSISACQKKGGLITITTKEQGREVLVTIKDDGDGISKEGLSKIFQVFEKTDISLTSKKMGLGLGLVICKKIVDLHGGRIWVESQIGEGTTVGFSLLKMFSQKFSSK